ncbi:MAG: extracellular solute-binding protein [Catenulispora sp.]
MRKTSRTTLALLLAGGTLASAAACSSSASSAAKSGTSGTTGASGGGGGSASYTFWDPYPQFDGSSDWGKRVAACGTQAGVTVKRTSLDTSDVANKTLLAAQQGDSPDVILVDNPVVSTLAEAGVLNKNSDLGLDDSAIQKNIIGAGVVDGAAYGVPIGANTLALYYNQNVLKAAGVDPTTVKDWASLTAALQKVKAAGKKGITFSAIGTEEGSFQFLPWFWGAGGDLKALNNANGVAAVTLWKDWVAKGLAPNDVLQNTQTTSWQEFATGDYAFGENGTWQLANAAKAGFPYGIINIPGKDGGSAPAPTGGEFVTIPVQKDKSRYDTDKKIVNCLINPANLLATDTTLSYVAPIADVQTQQVAASAPLKPWVDAVAAAKGRTSGGLGVKYPVISQQLWTAVQAALSGGKSPQSALDAAQQAAQKG